MKDEKKFYDIETWVKKTFPRLLVTFGATAIAKRKRIMTKGLQILHIRNLELVVWKSFGMEKCLLKPVACTITIWRFLNDDSSVITKWSSKLIDDTSVKIYDHNMFIIQATVVSLEHMLTPVYMFYNYGKIDKICFGKESGSLL